jgi:hypothetical protein
MNEVPFSSVFRRKVKFSHEGEKKGSSPRMVMFEVLWEKACSPFNVVCIGKLGKNDDSHVLIGTIDGKIQTISGTVSIISNEMTYLERSYARNERVVHSDNDSE